jgi:fluoride exporter
VRCRQRNFPAKQIPVGRKKCDQGLIPGALANQPKRSALNAKKSDAMGYLYVFLGGGLGAMLRHGVNLLGARLFPGWGFPIATLTVNITGSIVMGVLAAIFAFKGGGPQHWRLFLTTGILGGYTTFSSFSLDVAVLYERSDLVSAAVYILASVVLSVAGLLVGLTLTRYVL